MASIDKLKQIMALANSYYQDVVGHSTGDDKSFLQTCCTIEYLLDCGFSAGSILDCLVDCKAEEALAPGDLPEKLWAGSLMERECYYYHRELHLTSPPPILKADGTLVSTPFSDELKIRYTANDVLRYFCKKMRIDDIYIDEKRNLAQINNLLTRFRRFRPVEPLDMLLYLIDEASYKHLPIADIFGVASSEAIMEVHDKLERNIAQAKLRKADAPLWRQTLISKAS